MAKTMKVVLRRFRYNPNFCALDFPDLDENVSHLCWDSFRKIAPVLTKGLRKGQRRDLIRTTTKYGFKLELAKKEKKNES